MISSLLYFILVLLVVVFIHEFGHYFVAKRCGVKIIEFAVGMGSKIFGRRDRDGVEWKLCCLPIGGYVKMFGDDNASSFGGYSDNPTEDELRYSLIYKHPFKKILVAFAGPFANLVLGFLLFFVLFATHGRPVIEPVVSEVLTNSRAEKAGILVNDRILSVNGHSISSFDDVSRELQSIGDVSDSSGTDVSIDVLRGDSIASVKVRYTSDDRLGIVGRDIRYDKMSLSSSLATSAGVVSAMTLKTMQALWNIVVKQKGLKNIGGPIAIARESGRAGSAGFLSLLYFIALISVSLGAVNLIPIPMLDGGHIVINTIELLTRRRFSNFAYKLLFSQKFLSTRLLLFFL